jgi:peptidoglycan/xylan/chitin deacetylase (PgdA/CDA1 family)
MKKLLFALLYAAGVNRLAAWWQRRRVVILCYHGITKDYHASQQTDQLVYHELFCRQLDYLKTRYRIISLSEYLQARAAGRALPPYSLILTFDDGYRDFLTVAAPLLAARSLPATIFLITDKCATANGNKAHDWLPTDDWAFLSWADTQALMRIGGIEFGSHSCSHKALLSLSPSEIEHELTASSQALAQRLGRKPVGFAYPYGLYTAGIARQVRAHGYACALTGAQESNEPEADLFSLRRLAIGADESFAAFAAHVSGLRLWLGISKYALLGWRQRIRERAKLRRWWPL